MEAAPSEGPAEHGRTDGGPRRAGPVGPGPISTRRKMVAAVLGALVVALAIVLALASRDDGGSPSTTTAPDSAPRVVPADEWREQVDAACERWNDEYDDLPDARPGTAEEAIRHTADVEELAAGLAGVLADAGLPEDGRERAEQLVERSAEMAEAAAALSRAARDADGPGVDRATERIDELGEQVNELADALDVPACGGY